MTYEQLKSIPFRFVSHLSKEDEHCTTYATEDGRISFCSHVHYKYGQPHGRSYRHYMIDGKVYKTNEKFIKALEQFEPSK